MFTTNKLSLILALATGAISLTGCATSGPGGTGDDDGSGSGSNGGDGTKTLDATGKYSMHSTFDIASNMPGTVGNVVGAVIDATDSPDDPTHWILDQIVAAMPSGFMKTALQASEPFVAGYLNDRLLDIAPNFVTTMVQVGNDFGDMAKHCGINETLEVTKSGTAYTSVHTAMGAHFNINGVQSDYAFADFMVPKVTVNGVGVTIDSSGNLKIADHKMPMSYGKILRIGLDAAIIPAIDPYASDLGTLLTDNVNCDAVGQAIGDALGFGGGSAFATACSVGLNVGAGVIYSKIDGIDGFALEFAINGTAKALDKNGDGKVDSIQTGKWAGNLSYGGTPAPLAAATFIGERM